MANKVIFLDFDGPMIPIRAYWLPNQTKPASVFDPVAVSLLNKLVRDSGAKIVISSSWRGVGDDESKEKVFETLVMNGVATSFVHEDWATPWKFSSERVHEIPMWLNDHPEVTHYVAIDDIHLDVEAVPFAVRSSSYEGFSLRNYLESRIILDVYIDPAQKEEHKVLIDYLKKEAVRDLERGGGLDPVEMIERLFGNNEEE